MYCVLERLDVVLKCSCVRVEKSVEFLRSNFYLPNFERETYVCSMTDYRYLDEVSITVIYKYTNLLSGYVV